MLDAADLAMMQETGADSLTTPCTIEHQMKAPDGMLGRTSTWSTPVATVCHVATSRRVPDWSVEGGETGLELSFDVILPYGTDVRVTDRITVAGVLYQVVRRVIDSVPIMVLVVCQAFE